MMHPALSLQLVVINLRHVLLQMSNPETYHVYVCCFTSSFLVQHNINHIYLACSDEDRKVTVPMQYRKNT